MSLFKKIKKGLGFGTAKVEIKASSQLVQSAEEISGQVVITAQSEQNVKSVKVYFQKVESTGSFDEKEEHTSRLASALFEEPFTMSEGEEKVIDFTIPIRGRSEGISTTIKGVTISFGASNPLEVNDGFFSPDVRFELVATADLEGVAIDPTNTHRITIV